MIRFLSLVLCCLLGACTLEPSDAPATELAELAPTPCSDETQTDFFNVPAASGAHDLAIPENATGFRVAGLSGGASDPFTATVSYGLRASSIFFDWYSGPDLLVVHGTDQFLPIPEGSDTLRIAHGSNGAFGAVVWQLRCAESSL